MDSKVDPTKRIKIKQNLDGIPSSSSALHHESDLYLMPDFPNELAVSILSRLPAKSLGKFKCVSKPWLSLISSQRFIKTHLAISSGREDFGHHRLIITFCAPDFSQFHEVYSASSLLHAPTSEAITPKVLDLGYRGAPNKFFWPVGSCNGLVCFRTLHNKLFLYNPCLKMYKRLPDRGTEKLDCPGNFGFGYDELNDDYKLVWLFQILSESNLDMVDDVPVYDNRIKVYSLKDDAWRELKDLKIGDSMLKWSEGLQYASGKLHWLLNGGVYGCRIATFDLVNETYQELEPPLDSDCYDCGLGEIGGCLSLFCDYGRTHTDIWVMKDSWIKFVSIPYVDPPSDVIHCSYRSVCLLRNGEILIVLNSNLLLYNLKANTFRSYPRIGPIGDVIMYVESLVSP